MSEVLEYIESYFQHQLSEPEKLEFEERCIHDKEFADEVAFYISFSEASSEVLLDQKMKEWAIYNDDERESDVIPLAPLNKTDLRRWFPYAAAACFILAVIGYSLYSRAPLSMIAVQYIQKNYAPANMMSGASDSLQLGISAYKQNDYKKALYFFQQMYLAHPENSDAEKYTGLSYLMLKDFDNALLHFKRLSEKQLTSNPGLFLQAATLLERNHKGDEESAKPLLEQVVKQDLEGNMEARNWLKKLEDK